MVCSFFTILLVLLGCFLFWSNRRPKGYPPGPSWLPVVGNLFFYKRLYKDIGYHHEVWNQLAQTYGPVVGLKLGSQLIVGVTGSEAVKQVMTREEFGGRPDGFLFRMRTFGKKLGVVFSDGPLWKTQRKFSIQHLVKFGMNRNGLVKLVNQETRALVDYLKTRTTESIFINDTFRVCVVNSLWAMLAGDRFDLEDAKLARLLEMVNECFRLVDFGGGLINQIPFLRFIIPERSGYRRIMKNLNEVWSFLEETIKEHKQNLLIYEDTEPRDLIDAFLKSMHVQTDSSFTDDQLMSLCLDLFMAGSETTSNSLAFAAMYMIQYPEVQKKIQEEMDENVGRNRWPDLSDRPHLKFTEATLLEIQRYANVAPLGIAHRAVVESKLFGYTIPKDTTILTHLQSVHMDPTFWKDPMEFRPERFLDEQGRLKKIEDSHFMVFGIGKRRCLGEELGRSSMFLFFTALLHNFILEPDWKFYPEREPLDGFTLSPKPFKVKLTYRE